MQVYEFYAVPENGVITIPEKYKNKFKTSVKVTLFEEQYINTNINEVNVRKRKSIQELFAEYNEGFFQTEEIDWGKPQGNEVW